MGSYYAIKEAKYEKGEEYFDKVLALDPNDKQAKEVKQAGKRGANATTSTAKKSGR